MFLVGDYAAGALIGAATGMAVRALVWPGMDMVLAMLLGMAVGMVVHLVLSFALAPLLGMFETMIPASVTGMYGGMFFGMRDSMAAGSPTLGGVAAVGALFGALVVLAFHAYDRILRGAVVDVGE
jgi:hypothetical protein